MKKIHFLLLAFLVASGFDSQTTDPLEEGLVAHYSFNQCDARDDTGNGSDGILYGNPGCHCGVEDDAISLDGLNDYVEFHGKVNRYFTTSDFTVSFYFKPGAHSVFKQSLLSKRPLCDEYNMLDLQLDRIKQEVNTAVYETPEKYFRDISPKTAPTDWLHFALVREGMRAYTFINGELRQEGVRCSGVDISNEAVLSFSNSPCLAGGRTVRFKGMLDELRIYDRALSHEEVAKLYARHPVELAEIDCITYLPQKPGRQETGKNSEPSEALAGK
jgi:hypothetical protein